MKQKRNTNVEGYMARMGSSVRRIREEGSSQNSITIYLDNSSRIPKGLEGKEVLLNIKSDSPLYSILKGRGGINKVGDYKIKFRSNNRLGDTIYVRGKVLI